MIRYLYRTNIGEVAVALGVVDTIAYYERIWDSEAEEVDIHLHFAARGFIQERAEPYIARAGFVEMVYEEIGAVAGVYYIFYNQDVAILHRHSHIGCHSHISAGAYSVMVAFEADEIDENWSLNAADQVGCEYKSTP